MKKYDPVRPYADKQEQFDRRYLEMALIWARNSYCKRRQVGALIVKEKMIISTVITEHLQVLKMCVRTKTTKQALCSSRGGQCHNKVAKSNNSSEGATLYITSGPCMECAKLIIQAGIRRVVFCDKYHTEDGVELLNKANIEVVFIEL